MIGVPIDLLDQDPQMQKIKAGSHSRLAVFEACKFHAKLAFVDRIPEPARPLPPGKTEHANDRGTRIHEAAEKFVGGGVELIAELKGFEAELLQLRELAKRGQVSTEGEWAFDRKWGPVAWMSSDVWIRIKCDAVVFMDPSWAVIIDYKSGKRWGNEIKHAEQMQLYQLGAFLKYPKLKRATVELWYTDQDELHSMDYKREQGLRFVTGVEKRMTTMLDEEEFPPNPNIHTCRWCPYKPTALGGTGHCSVGV
jgi:CRISPR/Cas system-associated exonuclease Cas4 (RecB family)